MASSRFSGGLSNIFSDGNDENIEACGAGFGSAAGFADVETFERQLAVRGGAALARAIETEIIPRLMLAHRTILHEKARVRRKNRDISTDEAGEFAGLLVKHDLSVAEAFADALIDQGASIEVVFTNLFAPAARLLGEWWESDQATFAEVTIGLSRIHQLVHKYSPFFTAEPGPQTSPLSALLTPLPGEQHSLGILLLEQYLRRAGMRVTTPATTSVAGLIAMVRQEHYDMVGISVTCDPDLERISELIGKLRKASRNKELVVMVGGRVVNDMPDFVERVGADGTDADGSKTVERLASLVAN